MQRVLAAFAILLLAGPAYASLTVCNKTAKPAKVALGRFNGTRWMSQGWWTIDGQHCTVLIHAPLDARYYYLYASDGGSGVWYGGHGFCTASSATFEIIGRGDCAAHGYDRKGFFEMDTGAKRTFTQSLSD